MRAERALGAAPARLPRAVAPRRLGASVAPGRPRCVPLTPLRTQVGSGALMRSVVETTTDEFCDIVLRLASSLSFPASDHPRGRIRRNLPPGSSSEEEPPQFVHTAPDVGVLLSGRPYCLSSLQSRASGPAFLGVPARLPCTGEVCSWSSQPLSTRTLVRPLFGQ